MIKNTILRMSLAIVLVVSVGFLSFLSPADVKNLISGKVTSTVYVRETPPGNCSIDLKEGVNMVSFYCDGGMLSVNESLKNRLGVKLDYFAVFSYNPANINDAWYSYNPHLPNWTTQSITNFNRKTGYAVVMNSEGTYYYEGYKFTNNIILLSNGWNFIGYPTDSPTNVSDLLVQIEGKYVRVEAYQMKIGENYWRSYPSAGGDVLESFEPMIGYWILMNQTATLTIN